MVFLRKVAMGPTNVALTRLLEADKALREAQANLENASRSVRLLERRVKELTERSAAVLVELRQSQARYGQLELDIRSREEHIEKLRSQQQNSKTHKEYQAFLTEINTAKIDKSKVEDEALKAMVAVDAAQKEAEQTSIQLEAEKKKLAETNAQIGAKLEALRAEVDGLAPLREEAAKAVPAKALDMFDRLAERHDGEAMAPIARPNRRVEEYACGACYMGLVVNVYNRLHSRDEVVTCPNCHRILYIPEDLPVEAAIIKRQRREPRDSDGPTVVTGRQVEAADIMRSVEEEPQAAGRPGDAPEAP
jgi:uncharacterized protein